MTREYTVGAALLRSSWSRWAQRALLLLAALLLSACEAELYNNLNGALEDLRKLVADVRRDPQKYLRVRVSLF